MITKVTVNKMDVLVSLYIACIAIAELMGGKTFPINIPGVRPLHASVAIFVLPLIFTINDVITEVHGKERARSVVRSGLFMIVLFLLFSLFATQLPASSRFAASESAYDMTFGLSARIAAASLTAFTIAEFMDVFIFVKIKQRLGKKALWLRNNVSNIISQLLDTIVFMTLAFYATNQSVEANAAFLTSLIIPYWLLKCFMSVIETPLVYLGVKWLKKDN
jgi:queuosine precursor transporter